MSWDINQIQLTTHSDSKSEVLKIRMKNTTALLSQQLPFISALC